MLPRCTERGEPRGVEGRVETGAAVRERMQKTRVGKPCGVGGGGEEYDGSEKGAAHMHPDCRLQTAHTHPMHTQEAKRGRTTLSTRYHLAWAERVSA